MSRTWRKGRVSTRLSTREAEQAFDKQQAAFIVPIRDKGSGQGVEHTTTVHALWCTCPLVLLGVPVYHVAHTRYTRSNAQGPAARKGNAA